MNPDAIRSHYVKAPGAGIVRIWIQEERGAIVPVTDARANVRVPFVINWMRVLAMALMLLMIAVWRPGSRLWRITLDPSSTRQRLAFVGLLAIPTLLIGVSIIHELWYTSSLVFHVSGDYTYDFDQYGHVADALVAGRPWLDLPVPEQLAATEHPYDVATRAQLLANGASPLYWDYAYYDGHWYSYFGVLPAVLLFVPYRLLAGHNLPTSAAEYILVLLFIIFFSLLVLRVIHRVMPKTSVAAASLVVVSSLVSAQMGYLLYRTNFYQIPVRRIADVDVAGTMAMARRGHVPPSAETIGPMAGGRCPSPLSRHDWPWAPCALRRISDADRRSPWPHCLRSPCSGRRFARWAPVCAHAASSRCRRCARRWR